MVFVDFIFLYVLGRVASNGPSGGALLTLTAAQKAAGRSRGARGEVAAVEDASPLPPAAGDLF